MFSPNFAKKQISRTGFQKGGRDGEIKSPVNGVLRDSSNPVRYFWQMKAR